MPGNPLLAQVERSGFSPVSSLVHLFVGGSELHGAKVGSTDDLDIYGVFIGPPEVVLGLDPAQHFVGRLPAMIGETGQRTWTLHSTH